MQNVKIEDIIDIFGEVVDISGVKLDENTILGDDISVDSGEMLRIISRIESKYSFQFSPKDLLGLDTIGDVLKAIRYYLDIGC